MFLLSKSPKSSCTITLNNIPVGETFRGTIKTNTGKYTGLFYKAYGKATLNTGSADVIVVRLDSTKLIDVNGSRKANLFTQCGLVLNYQPVDLIVEEKHRA